VIAGKRELAEAVDAETAAHIYLRGIERGIVGFVWSW
jgi:hypothetical protein